MLTKELAPSGCSMVGFCSLSRCWLSKRRWASSERRSSSSASSSWGRNTEVNQAKVISKLSEDLSKCIHTLPLSLSCSTHRLRTDTWAWWCPTVTPFSLPDNHTLKPKNNHHHHHQHTHSQTLHLKWGLWHDVVVIAIKKLTSGITFIKIGANYRMEKNKSRQFKVHSDSEISSVFFFFFAMHYCLKLYFFPLLCTFFFSLIFMHVLDRKRYLSSYTPSPGDTSFVNHARDTCYWCLGSCDSITFHDKIRAFHIRLNYKNIKITVLNLFLGSDRLQYRRTT